MKDAADKEAAEIAAARAARWEGAKAAQACKTPAVQGDEVPAPKRFHEVLAAKVNDRASIVRLPDKSTAFQPRRAMESPPKKAKVHHLQKVRIRRPLFRLRGEDEYIIMHAELKAAGGVLVSAVHMPAYRGGG